MTALGSATYYGTKTLDAAQANLSDAPVKISRNQRKKLTKEKLLTEENLKKNKDFLAETSTKVDLPNTSDLTQIIFAKIYFNQSVLELKKRIDLLKTTISETHNSLTEIEVTELTKQLISYDTSYDELSNSYKQSHAKLTNEKELIQKASSYSPIPEEFYSTLAVIHNISKEKLEFQKTAFNEKLSAAKECIPSTEALINEVAAELDLLKPMLNDIDHQKYLKNHLENYNYNPFNRYWGEKMRFSPKDGDAFFIEKKEFELKIKVDAERENTIKPEDNIKTPVVVAVEAVIV